VNAYKVKTGMVQFAGKLSTLNVRYYKKSSALYQSFLPTYLFTDRWNESVTIYFSIKLIKIANRSAHVLVFTYVETLSLLRRLMSKQWFPLVNVLYTAS